MRPTRLFLLVLTLLALSPLARATAPDITDQATVHNARGQAVKEATDRRATTNLRKDGGKAHYTVSLPEGLACDHLYVEQADKPVRLRVEARDAAGQWQRVAASDQPFLHQYFMLEGLTQFRLLSDEEGSKASLGEIYLYGPGAVPDSVQRWTQPKGKMDMLLIVAHPDDELLWFGGTIPYYAGARGKQLLNVYMAPTSYRRQTEMLNGLWHAGQRLYPVLGPFRDIRAKTLKEGNEAWGKYRIERVITSWLREWQPDVVLTHAENGEYGHGVHRATSAGVVSAVAKAAKAKSYEESAQAFGTWQVKKLYLHLGGSKGRLEMDWSEPQEAFGGRSSIQVAAEAFGKHVSQQGFRMPEDGTRLDNRVFQLVHSEVGQDKAKNDFLENIPLPEVAEK